MKYNTNFVETRDAETLEELICELPTHAAEKQNQTTTEQIMITACVRTPLVLLLKTKWKVKKLKQDLELSKITITESNAKERSPEVLIQSEYIFTINACKTFLLSVSEENYQQTRHSS